MYSTTKAACRYVRYMWAPGAFTISRIYYAQHAAASAHCEGQNTERNAEYGVVYENLAGTSADTRGQKKNVHKVCY